MDFDKLIGPGHPAYPPQDVIDAAEKVGRWFTKNNVEGWQLGPCADRNLVRATPPATSTAQTPLQQSIEEDAAAFEAKLGYKPERIASTAHPWGWMYGWRDTQDAFRKFCKERSQAPSTACEVDELHEAGTALLQYLDDHGWGGIVEGETANRFRAALASKPVAREVEPQVIDQNKLGILVAWYLAGKLPTDLMWNVQVTAEGIRRALGSAVATNRSSDAASRCRAQGGNTDDPRVDALAGANQQLAEAARDRAARAERLGLSSGAEVDVEAERKLAGAPVTDPEDNAFYDFWYGHMLNDLMQPPLVGISHATARYIWDAARRTQEGAKDGYVLVPINATNEIICAIERSIDSQLVASGLRPLAMQRQDGERVWDAAIAAQTKEQQNAA